MYASTCIAKLTAWPLWMHDSQQHNIELLDGMSTWIKNVKYIHISVDPTLFTSTE